MISIAVSLTLCATAALLVAGHLRAWRTADHGGLGAAEREFHERRFRRRFQASIMLGVIGLLVLGDLWLEKLIPNPLARLLYWSGVMVLLLWLLLLAAGDWLASRAYYRNEWNRLQTDRTVLRADLERLRREDRQRPHPQENVPPSSDNSAN